MSQSELPAKPNLADKPCPLCGHNMTWDDTEPKPYDWCDECSYAVNILADSTSELGDDELGNLAQQFRVALMGNPELLAMIKRAGVLLMRAGSEH